MDPPRKSGFEAKGMENVKFLSSAGISLHLSLDFFIKTSYLNGWMVGSFVKLSILPLVESFYFIFFAASEPFGAGAGYPSFAPPRHLKLAGVWMRCSNILQNNERMPEILLHRSSDPEMVGNRYSRTLPGDCRRIPKPNLMETQKKLAEFQGKVSFRNSRHFHPQGPTEKTNLGIFPIFGLYFVFFLFRFLA